MGKIIGHYKEIILFIGLCVLVFFSTSSAAAIQEDELFEKAYENYLSYQPDKALEYFNDFLANFPDSSAKDAVLFWKARSLTQLKRPDEALKILSEIKRAFPGSPFIPFVEKELFIYNNNASQSGIKAVKKEATEVKHGK